MLRNNKSEKIENRSGSKQNLADRSTPKHGIPTFVSAILPLFIYTIFCVSFFGKVPSWTRWYFGQGPDPITMTWFIHWWSFSISRGLNPFVLTYVWFPHGFNFAWATTVPLVALVCLPISLLGGPLLAYNFLSIMSPALSAWTAFFLCRYITRDWAASLIGGYLFGFSSYEIGQAYMHLNMSLTFLVPLAVLLCLMRFQNDLSRFRFTGGLSAILTLEFGISSEIVATICVFGAITWIIFFAFVTSTERLILRRLAFEIVVATVITIVLSTPFLYYLMIGSSEVPPVINSPVGFSSDLLSYVIPTVVNRFGRTAFSSYSGVSANGPGQGAYLGLPLIFLSALYFRDHIASPYTKALFAIMVVVVVSSLGPRLHIGGILTNAPLPWLLAQYLPLIRSALPMRFTMYVALCAAIVAALYLSVSNTGRWRVGRFALGGIACLFLLPNPDFFEWTIWPTQPFFTQENVRHVLGKGIPNVIILPYGWTGPGMAWQLDSGMQFTQSGGYVGFVPASDNRLATVQYLENGTESSNFSKSLRAFCASHHVSYILIGPGTSTILFKAISAQGWAQQWDHGVDVIKVPSTVS